MLTMTAEGAAAIQQPGTVIATLIHLELSTDVYLTTAGWDIRWGSQVWQRTLGLLDIAPIQDTMEEAPSYNFAMSGVVPETISLALNSSEWKSKPVTLTTAIATCDGELVFVDSSTMFTGRLSAMNIEDGDTEAQVTAVAEPLYADLYRPRNLRYTNADQQRLHPGDRGCEYVVAQADRPIVWPARSFWEKK